MIDKYGAKIFVGIVILYVLRLCFLFFTKNPYTMLDRSYHVSSGYVENNVIKIEEIDDRQTIYFIQFEYGEIKQVLVVEYPFEYRVESTFWFYDREAGKGWDYADKGYRYDVLDYNMHKNAKAKNYSWIADGVLYDDNIKKVTVDGEECKIIDIQLEDEKLRYFYYIYPNMLSIGELPAYDDITVDFIY